MVQITSPRNKIFGCIVFFIFLLFNSVYSQNLVYETGKLSESEYAERYEKLKMMYRSYLNSESFKYSFVALKLFTEKVNYVGTPEEVSAMRKSSDEKQQMMKWMKWIEANIEKTDFKDYNDAVAEYEKYSESSCVSFEDNKAFFDYLKESTELAGTKIFADVIVYIKLNHAEISQY